MSARDPEQPARQRRRSEETRPDRIAAVVRDLQELAKEATE